MEQFYIANSLLKYADYELRIKLIRYFCDHFTWGGGGGAIRQIHYYIL